jgi:hypothetical protein
MNCRLLKETENLVMSDMSYRSILNQGSILYKYQLSKQLFYLAVNKGAFVVVIVW